HARHEEVHGPVAAQHVPQPVHHHRVLTLHDARAGRVDVLESPIEHARARVPVRTRALVQRVRDQTATASSATSPSLAWTLTSRVTPPPAMMRTVQSPGPAKKRKTPSSDTTTSPVNSPVWSSSRA